jgi:hypothetical protein
LAIDNSVSLHSAFGRKKTVSPLQKKLARPLDNAYSEDVILALWRSKTEMHPVGWVLLWAGTTPYPANHHNA